MSKDIDEQSADLMPQITIQDLDNLLAQVASSMASPARSNSYNPLIGYGDPYQYIPENIDGADRAQLQRAGVLPVDMRDPVLLSDITDILSTLDEDDKNVLTMEMYVAGVFDDISDVYPGEGLERDEAVFNAYVQDTIELAQQGTELGFETTFLKVLMGAGKENRSELLTALQAAKGMADAAKRGRGSGRMIQYANTNGLIRSLKNEAIEELGRKASVRENRDFVKRIHNMQAKGMSVNVGAEGAAMLRENAAVEAGSMDYSKARNGMMQVILSKLGQGQ